MELYSKYINKLIEQFSKLPGVGSKSAQRLALHIINMPTEHVERFAQVMIDAKKIFITATPATRSPMHKPVQSAPIRDATTVQLWLSKIYVIWLHMKKPENMMAFIMYCMEPFLRCSESARMIFG